LRILHVSEPVDGGVASHLRDLVRAQLQRGHEVQAVVADRGPLAAELRALGAGTVEVEMRHELLAPAPDGRAARRIGGLLRRGGWDVVHTHESKAGALARPLARAAGLPVVHSPHMLAYTTQAIRGRGEARRRAMLELERALARVTDVLVVQSEHMRGEVVGDGVAPPERVVVVHNGVRAPEPMAPGVALPPGDAPVVGFLARMTAQKDPLTLVEALSRVKAPFRAALVGDGELFAEVRERAGDRAVVVPFCGVAPALAAFDLYVLPSVFESFGIAAVEAMGAGLPVIASDVGGLPEVVGDAGVLVPPRDPAALAAALDRLLADPAERRRLGEAGRVRAGRFTPEAMAEAMDGAYERARRCASARS
jgi:glycosyltransferase involved in cell wall biosynthesis